MSIFSGYLCLPHDFDHFFRKKMKSRLKKIKKSPIVKNVQNREIGGENNFGGV